MATCEGCFNHIEGCLVAKNIAALLTNTNIPSSDRLKEREKALTTATTDPQTCQNPNYLLSLTGPIQSHGK